MLGELMNLPTDTLIDMLQISQVNSQSLQTTRRKSNKFSASCNVEAGSETRAEFGESYTDVSQGFTLLKAGVSWKGKAKDVRLAASEIKLANKQQSVMVSHVPDKVQFI